MIRKITFSLLLLNIVLSIQAQVTPTLHHNNLTGGAQIQGEYDMALYNNEVYFAIQSQGKIVKVSLATQNAPVVDVLTNLTNPTGLSFVGNELYFLEAANALFAPSTGKLSKFDVTQGTPTITPIFTGLMYPVELKVLGSKAYVSEFYLDVSQEVDHSEISLVNFSGAPSKTVLHNAFYSIDDFDIKDNFLYLIVWAGADTDPSEIFKMDITTGLPVAPTLFYTDTQDDYFFKAAIQGNYMYLNADVTPGRVTRIDLTSGAPAATSAVEPFQFGANNAAVGELLVDASNKLIALGEYFDGANSTYLLYTADLNLLSTADYDMASNMVKIYPNPTSDFLLLDNVKNTEAYSIYTVAGKLIQTGKIMAGEKIQISSLSRGMYILKVKNDTFKFVKK